MGVGEMVAAIVVLLLALYGCAELIRRLCLCMFRCSQCAYCCRLAVPRCGAALEPLVRCLHSQTIWDDPMRCRYTLLLLSPNRVENAETLDALMRQAPTVLPITADQLLEMIQVLAQEE